MSPPRPPALMPVRTEVLFCCVFVAFSVLGLFSVLVLAMQPEQAIQVK